MAYFLSLLWIQLWIFVSLNLYFHFSRVDIPNYKITTCLTLQETFIPFSTATVLERFCISTSSVWEFQFLHILTNICYYLFFTVGKKWYFTEVLICITLMTRDNSLMKLLFICIFPGEILLTYFAYFCTGLSFYHWMVEFFTYSKHKSPMRVYDLQSMSHIVFSFYGFCSYTKFLSLLTLFTYFSFFPCAFSFISKK